VTYDDARPSLQERLISALSSSNLRVDLERRGDADYVAALGAASRRNGDVAGAVMRVHLVGSAADYREAVDATTRLTRHLNAVRNWRLGGREIRLVGELALGYHVRPACPACHGRRYEVPEGSPHTNGNICKPCRGSGKRPVQRRLNLEIRGVLAVLEHSDDVTAREVRRLLA
jgi:hypothetical protein